MPVIPIRKSSEGLRALVADLSREVNEGVIVSMVAICVYSNGESDWYAVVDGRKATVTALGEMDICRTSVAEIYGTTMEVKE